MVLLHVKLPANHGGASRLNLGDLIVIHLTVMTNFIAKSPL